MMERREFKNLIEAIEYYRDNSNATNESVWVGKCPGEYSATYAVDIGAKDGTIARREGRLSVGKIYIRITRYKIEILGAKNHARIGLVDLVSMEHQDLNNLENRVKEKIRAVKDEAKKILLMEAVPKNYKSIASRWETISKKYDFLKGLQCLLEEGE